MSTNKDGASSPRPLQLDPTVPTTPQNINNNNNNNNHSQSSTPITPINLNLSTTPPTTSSTPAQPITPRSQITAQPTSSSSPPKPTNKLIEQQKQPLTPNSKTKKNKVVKKKTIFAKKGYTNDVLHGGHLSRLVKQTGLSAIQIQALAKEFTTRVPSGRMNFELFRKELQFANDPFAERLWRTFRAIDKDDISIDEFILGISRFAPRTKLEAKIAECYDLFDLDKSGVVEFKEFEQVTKYSLRLAQVGVSEDKLNQLIQAEWEDMDNDNNGRVTKLEFEQHMLENKDFVNALTIHVPWVQEAFRKVERKSEKTYLDTEPIISVLSDLAVDVGCKTEEAYQWNELLKEHFYRDISSLRDLKAEDWSAMALPRRLFYLLKRKLDPSPQDKDVMSNNVNRKVNKMDRRLRYHLRRKKLQLIWLAMYLLGMAAIIIWTFFKYMTPNIGQRYYDAFLLLSPSFIVSRIFGALMKLNFSLLLLPVCYKTLTWMRATRFDHVIPIDSLMFFHRYVGASLLVYGLGHATAHCVNFYNLSQASVADINAVFGAGFVTETPTYAQLHATRTGVTGWLMLGSMLLMIPLAMERVRRSHFNKFFATHHLYLLIYVCLAIHDGMLWGHVEIIYWLIPSLLIFMVDRAITIVRSIKSYPVLSGTRLHKGDVLEFRMDIPPWFTYVAGHYVWINVPQVSLWEWHPFTLTSSPDQDYLSIHMNLVGDWTKAVGKLCAAKPTTRSEKEPVSGLRGSIYPRDAPRDSVALKVMTSEGELSRSILTEGLPRVRIDGPYGTASGDVFMYSHVVLVGGGIGVTPFVSTLKSICYTVRNSTGVALQGVHFIWVAKSQANFEWFIPVLSDILDDEDLKGLFKVSIYLTGTRHAINDLRLLGMSMIIKRAKTMLGEDLVTGLESSTTFGRPDFQKILLQANRDWAGNKVGVFFCGPEPLANTVKMTCFAINKANGSKKKGAFFVFHQEFF